MGIWLVSDLQQSWLSNPPGSEHIFTIELAKLYMEGCAYISTVVLDGACITAPAAAAILYQSVEMKVCECVMIAK